MNSSIKFSIFSQKSECYVCLSSSWYIVTYIQLQFRQWRKRLNDFFRCIVTLKSSQIKFLTTFKIAGISWIFKRIVLCSFFSMTLLVRWTYNLYQSRQNVYQCYKVHNIISCIFQLFSVLFVSCQLNIYYAC